MIEKSFIDAFLDVWNAGGMEAVIVLTASVGCIICWLRGKPLVTLFTGNGYIRQKEYDEDQKIIREERAATRDKLDAVAKDVNELVGYVKGRSSK